MFNKLLPCNKQCYFAVFAVLLLYMFNALVNNDQFAAGFSLITTDCIVSSIDAVVNSCLLKSGISCTDTFYAGLPLFITH